MRLVASSEISLLAPQQEQEVNLACTVSQQFNAIGLLCRWVAMLETILYYVTPRSRKLPIKMHNVIENLMSLR